MSSRSESGTLSVRFGARWSDVPGLLDYCAADGQLSVVLDYAVLRAVRKDQSVATCTWALDGRYFHTTMVSVIPADGTMLVMAREEVG